MAAPIQSPRLAPLLAVVGLLLVVVGTAILIFIGLGIYTERWSPVLLGLGIPGVLLTEFAGLASAVGGGALMIGALVAQRRAHR